MCDYITEVVNMAISQYDVETLVVLWKSLSCLPNRTELQQTIISSLPAICAHHGMADKQYSCMKDFVHDYDRHMFESNCNMKFNVQRLRYYAEAGDLRNVKIAIEREPNPSKLFLEEGLIAAARGGHRDLVDFFITKGCSSFQNALFEAGRRGHLEIMQYLMTMVKVDLLSLLEVISESGDVACAKWAIDMANDEKLEPSDIVNSVIGSDNVEIVRYALDLGKQQYTLKNWNEFATLAISSGSLDVMKLFIVKHGIRGYRIESIKNLETLEFLISRGLNIGSSWNSVLRYCTKSNDLRLMQFLVDKGLTDYNLGVIGGLANDSVEIVELFYDKINPDAETAKEFTTYCSNGEMVRFFVNRNVEVSWEAVMINSIDKGDLDLFELCTQHLDDNIERDYISDYFYDMAPSYENEYMERRLIELGVLTKGRD